MAAVRAWAGPAAGDDGPDSDDDLVAAAMTAVAEATSAARKAPGGLYGPKAGLAAMAEPRAVRVDNAAYDTYDYIDGDGSDGNDGAAAAGVRTRAGPGHADARAGDGWADDEDGWWAADDDDSDGDGGAAEPTLPGASPDRVRRGWRHAPPPRDAGAGAHLLPVALQPGVSLVVGTEQQSLEAGIERLMALLAAGDAPSPAPTGLAAVWAATTPHASPAAHPGVDATAASSALLLNARCQVAISAALRGIDAAKRRGERALRAARHAAAAVRRGATGRYRRLVRRRYKPSVIPLAAPLHAPGGEVKTSAATGGDHAAAPDTGTSTIVIAPRGAPPPVGAYASGKWTRFFAASGGREPQSSVEAARVAVVLARLPPWGAPRPRPWPPADLAAVSSGVQSQLQRALAAQLVADAQAAAATGGVGLTTEVFASRDAAARSAGPNAAGLALLRSPLVIDWPAVAVGSPLLRTRSPGECAAAWAEWCDPSRGRGAWSAAEDAALAQVAQRRGGREWEAAAVDVAAACGALPRSPRDCLLRYTRSLGGAPPAPAPSSRWTQAEDDALLAAVASSGPSNWPVLAAAVPGRAAAACRSRWLKVLGVATERRKGKWQPVEDEALRAAVSAHGTKWTKVAAHVLGRTDLQCRERWCNALDPVLTMGVWTPREDDALRAAVAVHGPSAWAAVAGAIAGRTDNSCMRRWKALNQKGRGKGKGTRVGGGRKRRLADSTDEDDDSGSDDSDDDDKSAKSGASGGAATGVADGEDRAPGKRPVTRPRAVAPQGKDDCPDTPPAPGERPQPEGATDGATAEKLPAARLKRARTLPKKLLD